MKISYLPNSSMEVSLLPFFLAISLLLGVCGTAPKLPESALAELEAQWDSLPGISANEMSSVRAWPAKMPAEAVSASSAAMETWCVEVEMSGSQTSASEVPPVIWIVTRASKQARWESAPLMTFSSLWPYLACEVAP